MGAISNFVKSTGEKASDLVQNFSDGLSSIVSKVQGYTGTAFEVAKNGGSFVGLQYSSIDTIRSSIRTYVTNVQTEIDKLNTEASNANALKGEIATAASQYVKAVSDVASIYVTALLRYCDKMYEYGEEYKKNDTNLAQEVTEEANAMSTGMDAYTEKY